MSTPEQDAAQQLAEYGREKYANPDLLPYIGPGGVLERFLAGEIVTPEDALTDESEWVIRALHPAQSRRLRWMLHTTQNIIAPRNADPTD